MRDQKDQKGQIVLILVLVMTVALAIGISVVQRSISDISTSSKVEESSRAFSAAEAGIEKAIQENRAIASPVPLGDSAIIQSVNIQAIVPAPHQALEEAKPIGKEELSQVWLADPQRTPPGQYYNQNNLDIYWGVKDPNNNPDNNPAIELTVIYLRGVSYQSKKFWYDSNQARIGSNKFTPADCRDQGYTINTSVGSDRHFFCKTTLDLRGLTPTLILLRARILYSSNAQPFAVQPRGGNCPTNVCSLPPQTKIYTATGTSGETTRKVQVSRQDQVVPSYFDYGIFSVGAVTK